MKKRVLAAAACLIMLLSGCSVRDFENEFPDTANEESYNSSSISFASSSGKQSHKGSSSSSSSSAASSAEQSNKESSSSPSASSAGQSVKESSSSPSASSAGQTHRSSSKIQTTAEPQYGIDKKILEAAYSNECLTIYGDGEMSGDNSQDFAENVQTIYGARQLFSDEAYETYKKLYEAYKEYADSNSVLLTKQEYVKAILAARPELSEFYDENGRLKASIKPAMYIGFVNDNEDSRHDETKKLSDPETEKQAFFRTAEWIVKKLDGKLPASVNEKGYAFTSVNYSVNDEGVIDVTARIDFENNPTVLTEKFHISGTGGFVLGDSFITYDTEKLAISSRDDFTFSMLAGDFIPDDCKVVCSKNEYSEVRFDIAEIAQKLPDLKELYMYQASADNRAAIAEMKNLEVLSYYVLDDSVTEGFLKGIADCPFKGLKKLRSLRVYADYTDYSFLNEMPQLTDIHVSYNDTNTRDGYKQLFNCPRITSLKISSLSSWINFELEGIEKLTKLKKLDISCEVLDFTPLGKLKNLEDLYVRCTYNSLNVSELSKAPKIKKMHLSDLKTKDWSFLKQMKSLTDLSLYYIPNIRNSDLAPLKQLRSLSLSESGCGVGAVGELPALEVYSEVMSLGGDFSVFKKCPRLRELHLLGCRNGVMDFAYIQNCPLEILNCNGTDVKNVELLANIKTLKYLYIASNEEINCGDMLKKALPNCEVSVDQPPFFHNNP